MLNLCLKILSISLEKPEDPEFRADPEQRILSSVSLTLSLRYKDGHFLSVRDQMCISPKHEALFPVAQKIPIQSLPTEEPYLMYLFPNIYIHIPYMSTNLTPLKGEINSTKSMST